MTKDEIQASKTYKEWMPETVVKIFEPHPSEDGQCHALVAIGKGDVIGHNEPLYSIVRFFPTGNKVQVSADLVEVSAEKIFDALLENYSRKLG